MSQVAIVERGARESRENRGEFMMILSGADVPADLGLEYPGELGGAEEDTKAKKRYEVWAKIMRTIHEELPEIPLVYVPRFFTHNDKVKGFTTDGDGRFNGVNFGLSKVWVDR